MKKLELVGTKKLTLPGDTEYLWRYFDIHKFLGFIIDRTFRFARMDQFEDPLEGIPLKALETYWEKVDLNLVQNKSLNELILDRSIFDSLPAPLRSRLNTINAIQKTNYVSCWFNEQRESMAMWNLYSNPDAVAIKVPFKKLCTHLKPKMLNEHISRYYGGKVDYQDFTNLRQFTPSPGSRLPGVALRKDKSFSHEKEFRFVITAKPGMKETTGIDTTAIDLKKLGFKVICHPRMTEWKKKNIKKILLANGYNTSFVESEIKLRS